jgi:hypothetical protein
MAKKKVAKKKPSKTWEPAKKKPLKLVYQFRITLLGIKPKIWRRIQIRDCFLEDLHWHIQGAFVWMNNHPADRCTVPNTPTGMWLRRA